MAGTQAQARLAITEADLCLFVLDWLSELHASLYLQPRRTPPMLSGQAEWQTRYLPAAAELMHREGLL